MNCEKQQWYKRFETSSNFSFYANRIHQHLNDLTCPFPIRWDVSTQLWIIKRSKYKLANYYIIACAYKALLLVLVTLLWLYVKNEKKSHRIWLITTFVQAGGLVISLCEDLMCYLFGAQIAAVANWSNRTEKLWLRHLKIRKIKNLLRFAEN